MTECTCHHDACEYGQIDPRCAACRPTAGLRNGLPETVPDHSDVTVTARSPIRHLCPHREETDRGHIEITWRCEGQSVELHSLAEYLTGWADSRISHEELTDRIAHDLYALPGLTLVGVTTTWNTAGMEVRCSTSGTPVVTP